MPNNGLWLVGGMLHIIVLLLLSRHSRNLGFDVGWFAGSITTLICVLIVVELARVGR